MDKRPNENQFCGVGDFPMLIPYSEVVKMVESARKIEEMERRYKQMQKQYTALHGMYFELVEKFGELKKLL